MTKYERYTSKDGATLTMSQWGGSPAELELYRKLAELEDKIENGTLVELPCKVGDVVYRVINDKRVKHPYKCKVVGIWVSIREEDGDIYAVKVKYTNGRFEHTIPIPFSEIGKTIFLTKAEAEAKLRELEGERLR